MSMIASRRAPIVTPRARVGVHALVVGPAVAQRRAIARVVRPSGSSVLPAIPHMRANIVIASGRCAGRAGDSVRARAAPVKSRGRLADWLGEHPSPSREGR